MARCAIPIPHELSGLRGVREGIPADLEARSTYVRGPEHEGQPPALTPSALYSTGSPATAERLGAPFLGRHRVLDRGGDPTRFGATLHAVVSGPVTLGQLCVAAPVELRLESPVDRFLVVSPAGAGTTVAGGSELEAAPGTAFVVQPGRPIVVVLAAGASTRLVGIERQAVLVHLSRLLDRALDRPLAFDLRMDLRAGPARRWNLALDMLQAELADEGSLLRSGIGQGQLEEFLISSLLYGQPSTYSAALARPRPNSERPATTAAKQFIETNLSDHLTLAEVAAAAGVSVRTLQAAFRSELRTTPVAYIRSRRLDRARAELADEMTEGTVTVTDVATRWGITHLGRFATEYRARFGESPSQTLRRHRPR